MAKSSKSETSAEKTVVRRASLVDELSEKLSREITAGRYKDHELLPPEPQLIARFGASRTVIREATKHLVSQGLVEVERGRGVRIVKHLHLPLNRSLKLSVPDTRQRLEMLLKVRRVVEPAAARLAAQRATPIVIAEMKQVQDELANAKDAAAAIALDLKFHRLLVHSTGNSVFELMLESAAELGRASRLATISEVGWKQAHQHHKRILDAVAAGQPTEAEQAMIAHLDLAAKVLRRHFTARQ